MPNIEVEIRSFVSREQFDRLAELFTQSCGMSAAETQETWYLDANHDLRLFRNGNIAKIVLKKGKIHDEQREELEVQCKNDDFSKLTSLFSALGHEPKIKWFRKRHAYLWDGITVTLDDTKGYGLIIELELLCEESQVADAAARLKDKMSTLGIEITPRELFDQKYKEYSQNWKELTKE